MNDLLGRLRHALERERAFVADASHELRSPLAILRGELELAGRPGRSHRRTQPPPCTASAEEADRLARITDDLLLLARGDASRLDLRLTETDLRQLFGRSVSLAKPRLAAAEVTCRIDVPAGTRARVDPDRIRQAIDNLLANAARFAPAGSVIVIAARKDGPDLRIEVRDDGPGFPGRFPAARVRALPAPGHRPLPRRRGRRASASPSSRRSAPPTADGQPHATAPGGGAVVSLWLPGASP